MPSHTSHSKGKLFLVPAPLDFGCSESPDLQATLPLGTLQIAASLSHWICENAKSARAYLKRIEAITPLCQSIQTQSMVELPREVHKKGDHNRQFDASHLLEPALDGHHVGLISEAGMPAVADPGTSVVRAAHQLEVEVVALVGPVSLLLALAASGLNGQNFAFVGYLPQDPSERAGRIRVLEALALQKGQTQLFIETPYRNLAMFQSLLQTLQHNTQLSLSSGLTLSTAINLSNDVKAWKRKTCPLDNSTPTVFAIGR